MSYFSRGFIGGFIAAFTTWLKLNITSHLIFPKETICPDLPRSSLLEIIVPTSDSKEHFVGKTIYFKCGNGTLKKTVCKENGEWSVEPNCEKAEKLCPEPPASPILEIFRNPNDKPQHYVGKVIFFRCGNEAVQRAECLANGKWSIEPKCVKETLCPDPPTSPLLKIFKKTNDKPEHYVGKVLYFRCGNEAVETTQCLANGKWSIEPQCGKETLCPDPLLIPPLEIFMNTNDKPQHYVGKVLYFRCGNEAHQKTQCLANGKWSIEPKCTKETLCRDLPVSPQLEIFKNTNDKPQHYVGKILYFKCGKQKVQKTECLANGRWSLEPQCEKAEANTVCPDPPRSPSIGIFDTSPDKSKHHVGKKLYFKCRNQKAVLTTCMADGKWSVEPRCG